MKTAEKNSQFLLSKFGISKRVMLVSLFCLLPSALFAAEGAEKSKESSSVLATVGEMIMQGGWLMIPIAAASILMVGVSIERFIALRRSIVCPKELWEEIRTKLKAGKVDEAKRQLESNETPLARLLHAGLMRWNDKSPEVSAAIEDRGLREAEDLQKHLPALQGVASISPLLGLLGTVVGMIKAFLLVAKENALGSHELIAEGIGMALTTTAAGLCVAIPALIFFYAFRGRIKALVRDFDIVARELLGLHGERQKPVPVEVRA